jgi:hypothetical protein
MKCNLQRKIKSFSLTELVIAIAIFTLSISAFAFLSIDSYKTLQIAKKKNDSSATSQGIINSILIIKNRSWGEIVDKTGKGPLYISYDNNQIRIVEGEYTGTDYNYNFEISDVYRDSSGIIVDNPSTGIKDPSSRKINLLIRYSEPVFNNYTFNYSVVLNSWNNYVITHENAEDFAGGTTDPSLVNVGDDIILKKILLPDWCKPELSLSKFDLAGQSRGEGLTATPGNAYVATGKNSSGDTFSHIKVTASIPPTISIAGSFDESKGNDIFVQGEYVYLATDSMSQTVKIVQTSSTPYTKVGYYPTYSLRKANSIFVNGNYGYVAYGNYVDIFDLSSVTGLRPKVTTITISPFYATIKAIYVKNNFLFISTANILNELYIYDISNAYSPTLLSTFDIGPIEVRTIYVTENTNTTILGTYAYTSSNELYILNTTNKSAPSLYSSYDTEGMSIYDMATWGNKLMIAGSGTTNYKVLNIENLSEPVVCGQITLSGSIYSMDVVEFENRRHAYILTNDKNAEFQIIEGGTGGGDEYGYGYVNTGTYTSPVVDLESENFRLFMFDVLGNQPSGTNIQIQFKISQDANTEDDSWFGPDGTEGTYFTGTGAHEITSGEQRGRYLQYKIVLTSNITETPLVDKIEIYYGK